MNPVLVAALLLAAASAAPMDSPVRVDLPVYDTPEAGPASDSAPSQSFEPENHPGSDRSDRTFNVGAGLISSKLHAASNLLGSKFSSGQVGLYAGHGGPFSAPVTTLEGALPEYEGVGSKALSVKDNLHHIVAGLFQPKPIVDYIREEDKFGNAGDKFYTAGRVIVGGAESVSNLVSTVLEVPSAIFKKITRVATAKLNNLGGRLIGLNR